MSEKATPLSEIIDAAVAKKSAARVSLDDVIAAAIAKKSEAPKEDEPPVASTGYWEDRGIAGKVWHPAKPPAANRKDTNVIAIGSGSASTDPDSFGIEPEIVAPIGNAALGVGLSAAQRAAEAAKAATGIAVPYVKYKAVHETLKALGVPNWMAEGAGFIAAGYPRRGVAAEAEAAEQAPFSVPQGQTQLSPLELTRKLRAAHQAASGVTKLQAPAEAIAAEVKAAHGADVLEVATKAPKLTVEEFKLAQRMKDKGKSGAEILATILKLRGLANGLPSTAQAVDVVKRANAAGRLTR